MGCLWWCLKPLSLAIRKLNPRISILVRLLQTAGRIGVILIGQSRAFLCQLYDPESLINRQQGNCISTIWPLSGVNFHISSGGNNLLHDLPITISFSRQSTIQTKTWKCKKLKAGSVNYHHYVLGQSYVFLFPPLQSNSRGHKHINNLTPLDALSIDTNRRKMINRDSNKLSYLFKVKPELTQRSKLWLYQS